MNKSDLKCGNVVEVRNGDKYLLYDNDFLNLTGSGYLSPNKYNENLMTVDDYTKFDIIKVYKDHTCKELLWERKEEPKPKPNLTEDEKVILRNLPKKRYEWISRDENGSIYLYKRKPNKGSYSWGVWGGVSLFPFDHIFEFIKWEDDEPYSIEELLKGENND